MRAKTVLFARVKDKTKPSGYRFVTLKIQRGRPVQVPNATAYYLRFVVNGKRVVQAAGTDLDAAYVALINHERFSPAVVQEPDGMSLRDALDQYLQGLQGKSKATAYSYRRALEEFGRFCGEIPLKNTARQQVLDYKAYLYRQPMSETTRHARLLRVTMFLKHFGTEKVLRRGEWPQPNERIVEAYTVEEVERMLAASTPDERLLLEMFLTSGARDLEVSHLVRADVRLIKNSGAEIAVLTIREKPDLNWRTKSKRDRTVRLPLEFTKRLLEARAAYGEDDLLFPNSLGKPDLHLLRILKRVSRKAGLSGRIDLHKFRATAATRWHANGMNIQDVKAFLGHRDIQTTMKYLAATNHESESVGRAVEQAFGV